MSRIHAINTGPELILRKALWRIGFRYRVNDNRLPGSPDIVLPKYRTVVFVHGCFWHGHKGCKYYTVPKTNIEFWTTKIALNQERDQKVWRQLEAKGWYVIIVWECELKKVVFDETVIRVKREIMQNGVSLQEAQVARLRLREQYQKERRANKEREASLKAELKKL